MDHPSETFTWRAETGNLIHAHHLPPREPGPPPAVIGFIHGIGEHYGRYHHVMEFFRDRAGLACLAYDRAGYGRSEGRKGYAARYGQYLDEIARLVVACERRYPDVPVVLYGHSMGGQLLLLYLIRRKPDISAAIVSAPHIRLAFQPPRSLVLLGKLMRRIAPKFSQRSPIDTSKLSRDPAVRKDYLADPLVHDMLSSQTGIDILEAADFLNAWRGELPLPTLLLHGEADAITSAEASKAFVNRNPHNLTLKTWRGLYHELHNEPEWERVLTGVLEWLRGNVDPIHRLPESV